MQNIDQAKKFEEFFKETLKLVLPEILNDLDKIMQSEKEFIRNKGREKEIFNPRLIP